MGNVLLILIVRLEWPGTVNIPGASLSYANLEHIGMVKDVTLQSKPTNVHTELIGTGSSVPATPIPVLKELNGLVTTVKQFKKNVQSELTILEQPV